MQRRPSVYSTGYAAVLFKKGGEKERRPKHNVNAAGIMGEMKGNWIIMRWRSSLWKLVWPKLLFYMITFAIITIIHVYALTDEQAALFATVIEWFRKESASLPLTFMLGFYVSLVVKRWWEQYIKLPWPDEVAAVLNAAVTEEPKVDDALSNADGKVPIKNITIRRTIVRYLILSYVLCLRRLSSRMRKEYPNIEKLVATELVRSDEAALIGDELPENLQRHGGSNWWLPLKWSLDIVRKCQQEKRIAVAPLYSSLVARISGFRSCLTMVASYGHVTVPLVYTQVVHLAVYFWCAVQLVAQQPIGDEQETGKTAVNALFMVLRFLFYFGWLNVAETLYNPFGEDDDDFELIDLLKRHIRQEFFTTNLLSVFVQDCLLTVFVKHTAIIKKKLHTRVCYAIVDDGSTCPSLREDGNQPVLDVVEEEEEEEGDGILMDVVEDKEKLKKTEE